MHAQEWDTGTEGGIVITEKCEVLFHLAGASFTKPYMNPKHVQKQCPPSRLNRSPASPRTRCSSPGWKRGLCASDLLLIICKAYDPALRIRGRVLRS